MSISLDLDEEQIAALQLLSDNLPPNLRCLVPIIESIREGYSDVPPHKRPLPVIIIMSYHGMA